MSFAATGGKRTLNKVKQPTILVARRDVIGRKEDSGGGGGDGDGSKVSTPGVCWSNRMLIETFSGGRLNNVFQQLVTYS